jgi:hypothetical protein
VISTRSLVPQHLQGLDNQTFLAKAYLELMGRAVDPTGFRDYMARLGEGVVRDQIWEELASSEESRRHALRSSGLQPALAPAAVRHVDDLLALEREHFVRSVYQTLLGREVDPTGLRDYLTRLDGGDKKQTIIADICADPVGQAFAARLRGRGLLIAQDALERLGSTTAEELLRADESRFLPAAAKVVLGRQLLPNEQIVYGAYLADGMPRAFVLQRMHDTPDGSGRTVPGLERVIRRYQQANRRTWRGWYFRNVLGVESDFPIERRIRAIARRDSLRQSGLA